MYNDVNYDIQANECEKSGGQCDGSIRRKDEGDI